jgi:hypothetical protein
LTAEQNKNTDFHEVKCWFCFWVGVEVVFGFSAVAESFSEDSRITRSTKEEAWVRRKFLSHPPFQELPLHPQFLLGKA